MDLTTFVRAGTSLKGDAATAEPDKFQVGGIRAFDGQLAAHDAP